MNVQSQNQNVAERSNRERKDHLKVKQEKEPDLLKEDLSKLFNDKLSGYLTKLSSHNISNVGDKESQSINNRDINNRDNSALVKTEAYIRTVNKDVHPISIVVTSMNHNEWKMSVKYNSINQENKLKSRMHIINSYLEDNNLQNNITIELVKSHDQKS